MKYLQPEDNTKWAFFLAERNEWWCKCLLKISALVSGDSWFLPFHHSPPTNAIHTCRWWWRHRWWLNVCHVSYFINWYAHLFDINMLFGAGNEYKPEKKTLLRSNDYFCVSDPFAYGLFAPHRSLCVLCNITNIRSLCALCWIMQFFLHSFISYFRFETQSSWFVSWSNTFWLFFLFVARYIFYDQ